MTRLLLVLVLLAVSGCTTVPYHTVEDHASCKAEAAAAREAHDGIIWVIRDYTNSKTDWQSDGESGVFLRCLASKPEHTRTEWASGTGSGLTFVYPLGPAFR